MTALGRRVRRRAHERDAEIVEQHAEERVAWRNTDGKDNAGVVTFHKIDDEGLTTLTMRRLGAELGLEAMSLYRHVPRAQANGSEDLLDPRSLSSQEFPRIAELAPWLGAADRDAEFKLGLELILTGLRAELARLRRTRRASRRAAPAKPSA